ncbi:hypothetical protein A3860_02890 [Niastella vici]|uniref:Uncharacterized protein n=1 Tax=Niastella vici TaxID=1703345 RepID=A0A1V9G9I5_9BACT|nr:hypothetical protein A3860_02890 [Niastella vici]
MAVYYRQKIQAEVIPGGRRYCHKTARLPFIFVRSLATNEGCSNLPVATDPTSGYRGTINPLLIITLLEVD